MSTMRFGFSLLCLIGSVAGCGGGATTPMNVNPVGSWTSGTTGNQSILTFKADMTLSAQTIQDFPVAGCHDVYTTSSVPWSANLTTITIPASNPTVTKVTTGCTDTAMNGTTMMSQGVHALTATISGSSMTVTDTTDNSTTVYTKS